MAARKQYTQWLWCRRCERAFSADLTRQPAFNTDERERTPASAFQVGGPLEGQFGVRNPRDGKMYARCAYEDCEGNLPDFRWWDALRQEHPEYPEYPETPKMSVVYPPRR